MSRERRSVGAARGGTVVASDLILGLVQHDEYRFAPSAVRTSIERGSLAEDVPPDERPLVAAAAAIAGGEPKRALRTLDGDEAPEGSDARAVAEALRRVAFALDRNWFPGGAGAVLEEGDVGRILGQPLPPGGAAVALLTFMASNVVAMAPTWRSVAEGSRRSGQAAPAAAILSHIEGVGASVASFGAPRALAYVGLTHADVLVRAGQFPAASGPLGVAAMTYQSVGDVAGIAATALVRGDWSAEPTSRPETLGLDLESVLVLPGVEISREPSFARELYDQASRSFTLADAPRGLAALEVRLAHLDRLDGAIEVARQRLARAIDISIHAGDGAAARLARIHLALLDIDAGQRVDADALGRDVSSWAEQDGSYSYARGLARLCLAWARRARESGDFVKGRVALQISDAINTGIGAAQEPALVATEVAEQYGGVNYRRALLLLTELDLDRAIEAVAQQPNAVGWLVLVDRAMRANGAAIALRDSEAIAASNERLRRLRDVAGRVVTEEPAPGEEMFVAQASAALDVAIASADVLSVLYRATAARMAGMPEEAVRRFEEALALASAGEPDGGLMVAVVLATMGRREEARPIVARLVAQAQLAPDLAAALFMRVGDPASAAAQLAKLDALGLPGKAWSVGDAALRAEVEAANGRWQPAGEIAADAIERYEDRLARLSRDVLRVSVSDDPDVVSLYTTAVRASLVEPPRDAAAAFRLSDRCRGVALADLLAGDAAIVEPQTAVAVRRWLKAGVLLAELFERFARERIRDGAPVRAAIADAERELDAAEAAVHEAAPELLGVRRRPPPTPQLDDVQRLLRPDALLVQYHVYDDEVIAWAVSRGAARVVRSAVRTSDLAGDARRFHRLCADGVSTDQERAELGIILGERLLGPLDPELRDHARIVVVPHGPLSLLPFHLLPFDGDVLGAARTISYLPAASLAPRWQGHPTPRLGSDALVVGDPSYAATRRLRQLPAAVTEAAAVAHALGAAPLLGPDATGSAVGDRLSAAHVVHLATHGRALDGAPNSAELALAGSDRLTVADLMGTDTSIDLAVLSACDTGRGTATVGGDVIGLTRALLAAGARDIVVSLWPVDDMTACLTMVGFYERLRAGPDVGTALAEAQAEVRRRSEAERATWYEELAARFATGNAVPFEGTREWSPGGAGPAAAAADRHPALWGPFIHVGL